MKTSITILTILSLAVFLTGCQFGLSPATNTNNTDTTNFNDAPNDSVTTYWVDYAIPQCEDKPWGNSLEPENITTYYEDTLGITVYTVEITPPAEGVMFCQACGCPTGTTVSIQTDAAGRLFLLENGFTEEDADLTTTTPVSNVAVDDATMSPVTVAATEDSTPVETEVVPADEITNPDLMPTDVVTEEEAALSAEDADMQQRVEQAQVALADYYAAHGSYPNDLAALTLTIETGDLVYTPIGSLPADYYDLVASYSTGQATLNP